MPLSTTPERLAMMLLDCHDSIQASYHLTQNSIDQVERPCWLVFIEDASFADNTTVDEIVYEQSYSIAYIGEVFSGMDELQGNQFELQAREVADAAVLYLLSHPMGEFSNTRNLFDEPLTGVAGIQWIQLNSRSSVTLFSRDAVEGEAFWGFTIDITVKEQLIYETVAF